MAFDPSVIGSIADNQFDPVAAQEKGVQLKDMIDREQLNSLQLGAAKEEAADNAQVKKILQGSKYSTPEEAEETASKLNRVSPKAAMDFLGQTQRYQSGKVQAELDQLTLAGQRQDMIVSAIDPIVAKAQQLKNSGASDLEVNALIAKEVPGALQQLRSQKLPDGKPILPDDQLQAVSQAKYDLPTLISWEQKSKAGAAALKDRREQMKADTEAKKAEATSKAAGEKVETILIGGKPHRVMFDSEGKIVKDLGETTESSTAASGGLPKAPTGFEYKMGADGKPEKDANGQPILTPITGGPKDPTGQHMSGRQAVFFHRVELSSNEAVQNLENIVKLPSTTSGGFMGFGGHETSIFQAPFAALKREVTTQESQDYQTMLGGMNRTLATIEAAGMAPGGSFAGTFEGLQLKAGDSNITKMRKLAQMSQDIRAGLEPSLEDPTIPEPEKAFVRGMLERLKKAVPWTQADITNLQRVGRKNSQATLADVGVKIADNAAGTPASPGAEAPGHTTSPSPAPGGKAPGGADQTLTPGNRYQHQSGATVEILPGT
jgi:hypothetical protein